MLDQDATYAFGATTAGATTVPPPISPDAHDPVVLTRSLPPMVTVATAICTQCAVVSSMMCCEGTEAMWELALYAVPAPWEISVMVAMWLVCHVVLLSNVDRPAIILAVVWMIAKRLHADLAA
jgi:hypothetical protein